MKTDNRLVCIPKRLPEELREGALKRAGEIEPKNNAQLHRLLRALPGLEKKIPVSRLAVVVGRKWSKNGVNLKVGFLEKMSAELRRKILLNMNAWNKTANVSFVETGDTSSAEVRIARLEGDEGGYWSYLGTEILEIPSDQPTMNFEGFTVNTPDSEFVRVVRHEAGHTLGFPHEHMRKELVDLIDKEKAITEFMATQGWSREEVIAQVLTPLEDAEIMGTTFSDMHSIMCYDIPGRLTKNGKAIVGGSDIDEADYTFAARVYPKPAERVSKEAEETEAPQVAETPAARGSKAAPCDCASEVLLEFFRTTRALAGRGGALPGSLARTAFGLKGGSFKRAAALSESQVKTRVIAIIDREATNNGASADKLVRLRAGATWLTMEDDLTLSGPLRGGLADAYNDEIIGPEGGNPVTTSQARACTTVADAIDLVTEHLG
jgi:hypothetical protein